MENNNISHEKTKVTIKNLKGKWMLFITGKDTTIGISITEKTAWHILREIQWERSENTYGEITISTYKLK